jgi:formate-dependent nitrite reductase cytochrome c552 subunit
MAWQMHLYLITRVNINSKGGGNLGMKRVLMMALALLIGATFITTAFAQAKPETTQAADKPADKKEAMKTFKGKFVSMDAAAKTIVAKDTKGEMTFDVSGVKKMSDLKAGQKIMVRYTEKDGKMAANTVVKQAAKKGSPKKEETKPAPAGTDAPKPTEPAKQ